jgi:serine phosphatase RsbU (regulator of sigma subunit)
MDCHGNEYGRPRLADVVSRLRDKEPQEIMRRVIGEVEVHSLEGVYEDDRILLIMKVV